MRADRDETWAAKKAGVIGGYSSMEGPASLVASQLQAPPTADSIGQTLQGSWELTVQPRVKFTIELGDSYFLEASQDLGMPASKPGTFDYADWPRQAREELLRESVQAYARKRD